MPNFQEYFSLTLNTLHNIFLKNILFFHHFQGIELDCLRLLVKLLDQVNLSECAPSNDFDHLKVFELYISGEKMCKLFAFTIIHKALNQTSSRFSSTVRCCGTSWGRSRSIMNQRPFARHTLALAHSLICILN